MAANVTKLPPRGSRKLDEKTIMRNRSSLDTLLQMGFPRNRIEKALAATGDKGIQLASNWLISHVNDPTLDDPMPRDYILYMCPVGLLQQEMLDFWQQSYLAGDWNRAHNYFPHITLCSFFKADDSLVSKLTHTLKTVADQFDNTPESIQLEYFSSTNFMGLFVSDECALRLRQITADYAVAVKKLGVTVEPHSKQLHVSLAYQFVTDVREQLESLARKINLNAPARWDLRLYSRDPRIAHCQVRKVTCAYTPREPDELNLCEGDFIVMSESELDNSADGWYQGMSWQMGCSGIFPGICTQRVAETETWTMHRSIPIIGTGVEVQVEENGAAENTPVTVAKAMRPPRQITRLPSHTYDNVSVLNTSVVKRTKKNTPPSGGGETNAHGAQVTKASCSSERTHSPTPSTHSNSSQGRLPEKTRGSESRTSSSKSTGVLKDVGPVGNRQLYVMRHGERIDFTFGKDWINNSFDQSGNYIRYDLNMPKCLPKRKGGAQDFYSDSPLTVQGHFQAKLVGEALAEKQVPISHVYVSPSLRCVETATSLLEGLGVSRPLHVEPGLFEWLGWYTSGLPKFMSVQELMDCGFRINPTYKCHWAESKFNPQETTEQYYDRCHYVTKEILSARENEGGNVLLVAHAASLEVCTRRLLGRAPRSKTAFYDVLHKVPYCSLAVAQEACLVRDTWYLIEPPVLPFAHSNNPKYNWTTLTSPDHG